MYIFAIMLLILFLLFHFKIHKQDTFALILTSFFCAGFIILLVIYSKDAILASKLGISLWVNAIFPSLFPFFVICNILINTNLSTILGKFFEPIMRPLFNVPGQCAFAFFLGMFCGYPIGAICTLDLYNKNLITKIEAERLLTFTNNSSPLFVISSIGLIFFHNKSLGFLLYICHILSAILVGMIFAFYKRNESSPLKKTYISSLSTCNEKPQSNIVSIFTNAIIKSLDTIVNIAGFIIFFSVIIKLLYKVNFFSLIACVLSPIALFFNLEPSIISGFFSGILEITSGTSLISTLPSTTCFCKLLATSFLLGFSGICIHFQVYSVISKSDLKISPFIIGKFLHGILNSLLFFIIWKL